MNFKTMSRSAMFFALIAGYSIAKDTVQPRTLIGKQAPAFSTTAVMMDGTEQSIDLNALKGQKVVLYFFPKTNTPGCDKQAKNFRDNMAQLEALGIKVIAISCDSIKSLKKFQTKHHLPFILVSDTRFHCDIAKQYGAAGFLNLFCKRKTFVIDEQGTIIEVFEKVVINEQVAAIIAAYAANKETTQA